MANAPSCASLDHSTISLCNSTCLDPSSSFNAQNSPERSAAEHLEASDSSANQNIQANNETFGSQTSSVSCVSESLDDILLQRSNFAVQRVGKFRPKPKTTPSFSKPISIAVHADDMVIVPPSSTMSNAEEHSTDPLPSVDAQSAFSKLAATSVPPGNTVSVSSSPVVDSERKGSLSQPCYPQKLSSEVGGLEHASSMANVPGCASLDHSTISLYDSTRTDPLSSIDAHNSPERSAAKHLVASVSSANQKIQANNETFGSQTCVSESLDDILLEPRNFSVQRVGKFQPKPKTTAGFSKSISTAVHTDNMVIFPPSSTMSNAEDVISPTLAPQATASPIEVSLDKSPSSDAPASASLYTFPSTDSLPASTEPSCQRLSADDEDAYLKNFEDLEAAISSANETSACNHASLGMEAPASSDLDFFNDVLMPPTTLNENMTDQALDHSEIPSSEVLVAGTNENAISALETSGIKKCKKRKASTFGKKNGANCSPVIDTNTNGNTRMELRKRKGVTHADKNDIGTKKAYSFSTMNGNNDSANDFSGEDAMNQEKLTGRTNRDATKTGKRQKRKMTCDEADQTNEEPARKRFSHSTSRKRRTVRKELLETPEGDIDYTKLSMKEIIILAEIKERTANKVTEALKKSLPNHRAENADHVSAPYDDDGPSASAQDIQDEDYQENQRTEPSDPPKLNYHSFMNRTSSRWSKSDTEMFYEAIRQFGTDFVMIQQLFPGKTRHQVKLKYKAEERKHPLQVADAMVHRSRDHSFFKLLVSRLKDTQADDNADKVIDSNDAIDENEQQGTEYEPQNGEAEQAHSIDQSVKSDANEDLFDSSYRETMDSSYFQEIEEEYEHISF